MKLFFRILLKLIPLITFPKLNVWLYRCQGYDIDYTARIYSSVEMLGAIDIRIGKNTFIGHRSFISGGKASISIGSDCDISDFVSIFCGTHEIDVDGIRSAGKGIGKNIQIGDGVWIGHGALIMPGVKIGNKAIIAAGSVVHKNVEDGTIVGGNPIQIIRKIYDR
jgi:acetyltransferase-like isoleucine patch superfamily enzyme